MRRASRASLAAGALLLGAAVGGRCGARGPSLPEADPTYGFSIDVSLLTLTVRAVDAGGNPILGLGPQDFRVEVGRREVPVRALDWIDGAADDGSLPAAAAGGDDSACRDAPAPCASASEVGAPSATAVPRALAATGPGRLVVVFVQADLNPTRISGQMRLRPFTRELLATLRAGDRVAVVSFDSHLKLWQDFAPDVVAAHAAIDRAMVYSRESTLPAAASPSLVAHLDLPAAREAASAERALELVAQALEPLPGEKALVFLGWGLGRFGSGGVVLSPAYYRAVAALRAAHAAAFVLDVTSADEHSLATGLEAVAEQTGGLYLRTFRLPQVATAALARVLSGYYVLTLDLGSLREEHGSVQVTLRGRRGSVLMRPSTLR